LVTGGAGFIGSHTVDALLNEGVKVWVLDDLSNGTLRNLHVWRKNPKLHFRKGNIANRKVIESLAKKVDAIVHLAALVSPYISVKKPEVVNAVNVTGTLNVLNASVKNKVQRVVFASSSSVYGNQSLLPISEDSPLHPVTPYGVSKLAGEKYCGAYYCTYGLSTIALRYFNVYGVRQSANPYSGVIAIFARHLSKGLRPTIYGDGEQTRDFIHVSDVVTANLQALQASVGAGETFNVGTGRATKISELSSLLAELVNRTQISPTHSPERAGDIRHSYADMTRAREILGFQPKVELKQGLKSLIDSISTRTTG
jgi:UDP-glucose 4-epimerase